MYILSYHYFFFDVSYKYFVCIYRLSKLLEEIMGEKEHKTLIFVETKRKCDEISRRLRRDGWPAVCIHGDKAQPERDWVLQGKF